MARKMVYEWREEAHIKLDPQAVGERLEEIKKRHDGLLTPEAVVADARVARSPLHGFFEWSDSKAATKYRLEQARYLIRHLVVKMSGPKMPEKALRAFVHVEVPDNGNSRSGYLGIREALSSAEFRAQVLKKALSELKAWQARYTELRELSKVFEAIELADKEFELTP